MATSDRKSNVVPLHKPDPPAVARFVPLITPSSADLPEGYTEHPFVEDGTLNGRDEPQGPTVIDFLVARDGITLQEACDRLKNKLAAGILEAEGPDGPIARGFWRYATIRPDGEAFDIKSKKKLPWFMVRARDVLEAWPPPPAWIVQPKVRTVEPQPTPSAPQDELGPEPTNAPPTPNPKRKFDEVAARAELRIRQRTDWPARPPEGEVQDYLLQLFETVPRPTLRVIRRSIWPVARRSGPKKKTDNPAK
jgi:hypothetical protein